jgi:hypothetical protein
MQPKQESYVPKFDFTGLNYYVGIDPQQSLLAINVNTDEEEDAFWFQHIFKKKNSSGFKTAEMWELYIAAEIETVITELDNKIRAHESFSEASSSIFCGVEQQRGRVNSLIEGILVSCGQRKGWIMSIPHPLTWKKSVGLKCLPGNKNNKNESTSMIGPDLMDYLKKNDLKKPARIHDLCDAKCISAHVFKMQNP